MDNPFKVPLLSQKDESVTKRVEKMVSIIEDRVEIDDSKVQIHLSLLVAGIDVNSDNKPRLYHIDSSGKRSIWTAAAIGSKDDVNRATESLEKKYKREPCEDDIDEDGIDEEVGNLDTAIPVALLALKDTLNNNDWTEIENNAEIIYVYVDDRGIHHEEGDNLGGYIDKAKQEEINRG